MSGPTAHVVLHIGLDAKRKKQISFDFDFHNDTSMFVAADMVKQLRLPDERNRTVVLIAVELESRLDQHRKHYFEQHRASSQQQQQPQQQPHTSSGQYAQQQQQQTSASPPQHYHQPAVQQPVSHGSVRPAAPHQSHPSPHAQPQQQLPFARQGAPHPSVQAAGGSIPGPPPLLAATSQPPPSQHAMAPSQPAASRPSIPPLAGRLPPPLQHIASLPVLSQQHPSVQRRSTMPSQLTLSTAPLHQAGGSSHRDGIPRSPPVAPTAAPGSSTSSAVQSPTQHFHSLHQQPHALPGLHQPAHVHSAGAASSLSSSTVLHPAAAGTVHPAPASHPSQPPAAAAVGSASVAGHPFHSSTSQPSLRVDPAHPVLHPPGMLHAETPPASSIPSSAFGSHLPHRRDSDGSLAQQPSPAVQAAPPVKKAAGTAQHAQQQLDVPAEHAEEGTSPLRQSRSDVMPASASAAAAASSSAQSRLTAESLLKQYSALSVSQLKDRIRAKGAGHRLQDCLEKKDLIDCLLALTPVSTLPSSPPSQPPQEQQQQQQGTPPGSTPSSRHGTRPSSPDIILTKDLPELFTQLGGKGGGGGGGKEAKDPFADLFTQTRKQNGAAAGHGGHGGSGGSGAGYQHSISDTPSPISATSPHHTSPQHTSPDPLSPTRPPSALRLPSMPVRNVNRHNSQPLIPTSPPVSTSPPPALSPMSGSHHSSGSGSGNILPDDPFAHIDAVQLSSPLSDWKDIFSSEHEKEADAGRQSSAEKKKAAVLSASPAALAAGGDGTLLSSLQQQRLSHSGGDFLKQQH